MLANAGPKARRASRQIEKRGYLAVPALLQAYDSPHEHQRWEIVNLLGYIKDPRSLPLLLERAIHDPEVHPRWRSIWALSSVDDGRAIEHLRSQVARSRGRRRRNAAVALTIFDDPAAIPVLRQGLVSEDAWIRWESLSCLVGYQDVGVAYDVLRLFRKEKDPTIRLEMVRVVAGLNSPPILSFLIRRLGDPNPEIRSASADALARSGDSRRARKALTARLHREQRSDVRRALRGALASLKEVTPS